MIDATAHNKLGELLKAYHDCGWSTERCEKFGAEILNRALAEDKAANYERKCIAAAKALPSGVGVVVEMQGCHRVTGYRRAKRGEKLLREIETAATR